MQTDSAVKIHPIGITDKQLCKSQHATSDHCKVPSSGTDT